MTRSHASLLSALVLPLLLAACQPSAPAADAGAPAASADAAASAGPSAEAEAAAASAAAAAGAVADTGTDPAAPAAETPAADTGPAPADALRPGVDYVEIRGGQPYQPLDGKVEVVEVFNYICPACARLEPLFAAWKGKLPADVRVTYVPAPWGPQWMPYARAYYVADAMGLDAKTHAAMFSAIHIAGALPGEGKQPNEEAVAAWYGQHGADPKQFLSDMHSFATEAKIKRGLQFMTRSQVGGTPTLVINGKYRVLGSSYEDMLRIADALIARERGAKAPAAP